MSAEQKQHIEQIRIRAERLNVGREPSDESDTDRVYENTISDLLNDNSFLLSIVKSQEAEWDGKERRIKPDERYRYGWCCAYDFEEGTYRTTDCIGRTRNADVVERLTSEAMRSACIEKVKQLARERVQQSKLGDQDHEHDQAVAYVLFKVAETLQSVSIQEQETKTI